jgi:hypothetical protein
VWQLAQAKVVPGRETPPSIATGIGLPDGRMPVRYILSPSSILCSTDAPTRGFAPSSAPVPTDAKATKNRMQHPI